MVDEHSTPTPRIEKFEDKDMSDDQQPPRRERYSYAPWATNLQFQYVSIREIFAYHFVLPLKFPVLEPTAFLIKGRKRLLELGYAGIPAIVLTENSGSELPSLTYDCTNNRLVIKPHSHPFADLRMDIQRPDCLPLHKLCIYQALEISGINVWRHDQVKSRCTLNTCHTMLNDHDTTTLLCPGCGPKTTIRYCSRAHMVADFPEHFARCGDHSVCIQSYVDTGTQPARFYQRYPAIVAIDGSKSLARHRQRAYAIFTKGKYTLFRGAGDHPTPVEWPKELEGVYMDRVERILNLLLLDASHTVVLSYLFALLRMALRKTALYSKKASKVLERQFSAEFGYDTSLAGKDDPCECMWGGDTVECLNCVSGDLEKKESLGSRGEGVEGLCRALEGKYWLLRVWRRRMHVKGWKYRLLGKDFEGVLELSPGMRPVMGWGWDGGGTLGEVGGWVKDDGILV